MIADLLAYLRDGYERDRFTIHRGRWCWMLIKTKPDRFAPNPLHPPEFVPLPEGWVIPQ